MIEDAGQRGGQGLCLEPGDVGLPTEPRQLALGEAAGRSDRLLDGLIEVDLPSDVLGELTVTDRLESRQARIQPCLQKSFDLSHPPGGKHRMHSARDAIVQDVSRQRQSDADGLQGALGGRRRGDPDALRPARSERHLEGT